MCVLFQDQTRQDFLRSSRFSSGPHSRLSQIHRLELAAQSTQVVFFSALGRSLVCLCENRIDTISRPIGVHIWHWSVGCTCLKGNLPGGAAKHLHESSLGDAFFQKTGWFAVLDR